MDEISTNVDRLPNFQENIIIFLTNFQISGMDFQIFEEGLPFFLQTFKKKMDFYLLNFHIFKDTLPYFYKLSNFDN